MIDVYFSWADHNVITNVTAFGKEAYPESMNIYYLNQLNAHVPFSTIVNVRKL